MYHIICYNRYFYNDPSNQQQGHIEVIVFPLNFKIDVVCNAAQTYFKNMKLILCN